MAMPSRYVRPVMIARSARVGGSVSKLQVPPPQRLTSLNLRVSEGVAHGDNARRQYLLPLQHYLAALAEQHLHCNLRHRQPAGPAHDLSQRTYEVVHAHRRRRCGIVGTRHGDVVHGAHEQASDVSAVDPGHPLPTIADWAASKRLKHGRHLGESASAAVQHQSKPQDDAAHTGRRGRSGRFPAPAHESEVVAAAGARLVESSGGASAIVAHS